MCTSNSTGVEILKLGHRKGRVSTLRWLQGMGCSSVFTLTYMLGPMYVLGSAAFLLLRPCMFSFYVAIPMLLSAVLPPVASPYVVSLMSPMLDYFEYEQIIECSPVDVRRNILNGKTYLIPAQPHGVLSFCGICSAVGSPEYIPHFKSAVASAVLSMPIIKHVMGLFGLCNASKASLRKELKTSSVVLYVGGIAELFLSCPAQERLFLNHRKGFIKLALTEGVDVVPIYCFGNTSILTIVKTGFLAQLSRKMQVSFTYFWGKFGLPIPRDEKVRAYSRGCQLPCCLAFNTTPPSCQKLLWVGGQPLGMPRIVNPTQEDIDQWHGVYIDEVKRLFDTYKHRVPLYKHKQLVIV